MTVQDWDEQHELVKRKCKTCGCIKEHAAYWWDFVSWNCEDCENKELGA